jgi:hypothetical protein
MSLDLESTVFLSGSSESTQLAVLVDWVADPVNSSVVTDSIVRWVHEDDLEVLVHSVLIYPVGVEHPESAALASNALLGDVTQVSDGLQLGNTSIDRLSIDNTLQAEEEQVGQ